MVKPLTVLRERVEKLTGPDREVDLLIGELWPEPRPFSMSINRQRGLTPSVFSFTASLDAAIALVEKVFPEMADRIFIQNCKPAKAGFVDGETRLVFFEGATPAIAPIVALLHSLEAGER